MNQIAVFDVKTIQPVDRLKLFLGIYPVETEEILLPFCKIIKYYLPYFEGINEKKISKIISKLTDSHEDCTFIPSENIDFTKLPVLLKFKRDETSFLRSLAALMVKRAIKSCGFITGDISLYVQMNELTLEMEDELIKLCDVAKYIYLNVKNINQLDETLMRIYDNTGACVIPAENFDAISGRCLGLIYDGLDEVIELLTGNNKVILFNLTGNSNLNYRNQTVIDGVIFDSKIYSLLKLKKMNETEIMDILGFTADTIKITGFTSGGKPLHLQALQNS